MGKVMGLFSVGLLWAIVSTDGLIAPRHQTRRELWSLRESTHAPFSLTRATTLLFMSAEDKKKKRRRKKIGDDPDDLPEFDLKMEKADAPTAKPSPSPVKLTGDDDPSLLSSMMGTAAPSSSAKDLLRSRDRSIESAFEFDEVATPLPRPGTKMRPGVGKKRAKAEARRAAAAAKAAEGEREGGFLSSLPFVGKKEGEEASPVKVRWKDKS